MSGTFRGGVIGLLVALAAAVACPAAPAATFGASGSRAAIHFYRSSQLAMARYATIRFTGKGTAYKIIRGGVENFAYAFGSSPRGFTRATDQVVVVQRGGRVAEEIDTLSADGLPSVRVWRNQAGTNAVGQVLGAKGCPVLFRNDRNSFVRVGEPFVSLAGIRFMPLQTRGAMTVVRSSYASSGGTAHQTDAISTDTRLWSASRFVLRGGAFSGAALSESAFSFSHRSAFQSPPRNRRCG